LAVQFRLIGVDLLLLICLSLLLALKLIADQQAGAEPKRTADGGTHSRMTHSCSDNTSNSGAAKGTDASILLPRVVNDPPEQPTAINTRKIRVIAQACFMSRPSFGLLAESDENFNRSNPTHQTVLV
jgi:hypothetical protein